MGSTQIPPPIKVELVTHDPDWAVAAEHAARALAEALGEIVVAVHHIGSTAIPGICAKPILDLMPVVRSLADLDRHQDALVTLGYEWWGELGLPSRRYCTKSDPATGRRMIQLHCYPIGSVDIERHLAFRDYLRRQPEVAREYEAEKVRCQRLHPDDSHCYGDCKGRMDQAD